MTKAEWVASDLGFERDWASEYQEKKHDGSSYIVRVYRLKTNSHTFRLECDNYYGRSKLYRDGIYQGDIEFVYETLPLLIEA